MISVHHKITILVIFIVAVVHFDTVITKSISETLDEIESKENNSQPKSQDDSYETTSSQDVSSENDDRTDPNQGADQNQELMIPVIVERVIVIRPIPEFLAMLIKKMEERRRQEAAFGSDLAEENPLAEAGPLSEADPLQEQPASNEDHQNEETAKETDSKIDDIAGVQYAAEQADVKESAESSLKSEQNDNDQIDKEASDSE